MPTYWPRTCTATLSCVISLLKPLTTAREQRTYGRTLADKCGELTAHVRARVVLVMTEDHAEPFGGGVRGAGLPEV